MNETNKVLLQKHEDILSFRELTLGTIKTYVSYLTTFLEWVEEWLPNRSVDSVTWGEIRSFILFLKKVRGLSPRTVNVHIAQLRNFYRYVLHKEWDFFEVPCLRFDERLPVVPTREEVIAIISSIQNPKHRAEIALLYSSGIRVSELCRLHCNDIHMSTKSIYISVSKNRSDRYAVLFEKALRHLIAYIRSEYPNAQKTDWLFPGQKAVEHITTQSVYETFRKQLATLGMQDKGYTLHSLRHVFGLHLYDAGVDIMTIKEAMGRKTSCGCLSCADRSGTENTSRSRRLPSTLPSALATEGKW